PGTRRATSATTAYRRVRRKIYPVNSSERSLCEPGLLHKLPVMSAGDQSFHSLHFRRRDRAALRGEPVITPPLIVILRPRPIFGFHDPPLRKQALDDRVESAGV